MKLFIITSRIPYPLEKGDKLRIFHQIRFLSEKFDIYLCAINASKKPIHPEAKKELGKYCKEVHFISLSYGGIIASLAKSIWNGLPFQTALFTTCKSKNTVRNLIAEINPDYVYCHLSRASEYVKHTSQPKTIDYMDAFSMGMYRRWKNSSAPLKWLYAWEYKKQKKYEKSIFRFFDKHTIITEQDRECIDHIRKGEIEIIRNGVDFEYFTDRVSNDNYDIVFVGNMSYPPNIDAAQFLCHEILPIIQQKRPQTSVLIAGSDPHKSVLALQNEQVHISGWMEDIREAYASAKLFIAPMRIGTGLQNKLLEAMSMQKACITTNLANKALGAPKDAIYTAEHAADLANHCINLLDSDEDRNLLAKKGKNFVKSQYSWQKTTEALAKLFLD